MATKLIVTENQYNLLLQHITENNQHQYLVEKIINDLNNNYEPMIGVFRENEEYQEKPMIKIKIDNDEISPAKLFKYMKKKYQLGDEFIKQTIKDWMFGNIKHKNQLSKNVPIT